MIWPYSPRHRGDVSQELSTTQLPRCVNIEDIPVLAIVWFMHYTLGLVSWLNSESSLYFTEVFHSEVR